MLHAHPTTFQDSQEASTHALVCMVAWRPKFACHTNHWAQGAGNCCKFRAAQPQQAPPPSKDTLQQLQHKKTKSFSLTDASDMHVHMPRQNVQNAADRFTHVGRSKRMCRLGFDRLQCRVASHHAAHAQYISPSRICALFFSLSPHLLACCAGHAPVQSNAIQGTQRKHQGS